MDTSCSFQQNFVSWHCLHVSQLHKLNKKLAWALHPLGQTDGAIRLLGGMGGRGRGKPKPSRNSTNHSPLLLFCPSYASYGCCENIHLGSGFSCQPTQISALSPFLPLRLKTGVLIYPTFLKRELYWGGGMAVLQIQVFKDNFQVSNFQVSSQTEQTPRSKWQAS